jgi:hypothetical protein
VAAGAGHVLGRAAPPREVSLCVIIQVWQLIDWLYYLRCLLMCVLPPSPGGPMYGTIVAPV